MKLTKIFFLLTVFLFAVPFFLSPVKTLAQDIGSSQSLVYLKSGDVQINNPEMSQVFDDNLKGKPRDYFINSNSNFELYINILVPEVANMQGRYSVTISSVEGSDAKQIEELDGGSFSWQEVYNSFDRDWYWKGPELDTQLTAGKYKIEVYSKDNQGEYVLVVGKNKSYGMMTVLNNFWQLPLLKVTFLKTSVMQFFLTPIGVAGVGILGAILDVTKGSALSPNGFTRQEASGGDRHALVMNGGWRLQVADSLLRLGESLGHANVLRLEVFHVALKGVDVRTVVRRRRRSSRRRNILYLVLQLLNGRIASRNLLL